MEMTNKNSFFDELARRRIPQIIGMYIATVWLAVEMADWMSNKFNILPQLSSYVFIGMLTFIPSLILLAWGHGRPGKDRWSIVEKVWIPINIVIALFAINLLVNVHNKKTSNIESQNIATDLKQIEATTSKKEGVVEKEIVRNNYNRVLVYFWDNKTGDKSLDWLSYASAWLFSYDLRRTPNISSTTPYSSKRMIRKLQNKGFDQATNIPLSLALQIAKTKSKKWLILGSFSKKKQLLAFEARLYKVEDGKAVKTIKVSNENMLLALDEVSSVISEHLLASSESDDNVIPDLAISDHISDDLEAIELFIHAMNAVSFKNDYKKAIKLLDMVIKLDNNFVAAHILASRYQQSLGDYTKAIEHIDAALAKDYKIYEEVKYELKASKYYMLGDRDKARLVQESWVRAFPQSPTAHGYLAGYYLYSNNKLDLAENELNILLKIDPDNPNTLINLGRIYRIQENKAKTLEVLGLYLQKNQENAEAYLQMGEALEQFGFLKKAIKLFEQASILGTQDFEAEINKSLVTMKLGEYQKALDLLNKLLKQSSIDNQRYELLRAKLNIYETTGQFEKALSTLDLIKIPAKMILSPFNYMFQIEDHKISILISQGRYKEALKYSQELRDNSKPPFDSIVGIFFLITYADMEDKENYRKEFSRFESFLKSFNNPYWNSFTPALKSRILSWDGQKQEAIDLLNNSVKTIKQSISGLGSLDKINEIEYHKATIMTDLEQFKAAIEVLTEISQRDPIFAKAYYLLAKIYKKQNKLEKFQQAYSNALNIWRDADVESVDLKKLKSLKS